MTFSDLSVGVLYFSAGFFCASMLCLCGFAWAEGCFDRKIKKMVFEKQNPSIFPETDLHLKLPSGEIVCVKGKLIKIPVIYGETAPQTITKLEEL
jgi:hypothetical protein